MRTLPEIERKLKWLRRGYREIIAAGPWASEYAEKLDDCSRQIHDLEAARQKLQRETAQTGG